MAKSNLLNTRTLNYLELIGNGRVYRVPPYQRDYSWETEQWEDLWNDIQELRGHPDERHYMGALVVEGTSDREFAIIDGQQRMATLAILALAVIKRLEELASEDREDQNRQRAVALRSRFIGEKDPASLLESSKLTLNATDDGFYQDNLVQLRAPLNPRSLVKSHRQLWNCFLFFAECIKEAEDLFDDGEALAQLLSETVARQLLFILITVDDELNAYMVFETLNARGLELSTTDLLKNYLFSRVKSASDRMALQRRWARLIATVRQERFPEFLRYHLLCVQPRVRSQRLFKQVREKVKSGGDVIQLLNDLDGRAELYSALSDPQHQYWIDRPECKPHVRELSLFRFKQMTPLLFAAWERFDPANFERVMKLVSIASFRYGIVGRLNTNELEPAYHRCAKDVLDGTARRPADVYSRLVSSGVFVDDAKFGQDFASMSIEAHGAGKRLAKYVLAKLESDLSGNSLDPDTDPSTIEHVLPENASEAWGATFSEEQREMNLDRLGNLTLLEAPLNRRCGNADYPAKIDAYRGSRYRLTNQIPEMAPELWSPDLIAKRQSQMAVRALHVWRSDFAK